MYSNNRFCVQLYFIGLYNINLKDVCNLSSLNVYKFSDYFKTFFTYWYKLNLKKNFD